MKLIDRYLLRTLCMPLLYCLFAFTLLTVVLDLFQNLKSFIAGNTPPLLILKYYGMLLPALMKQIVPVCLLLAVLYALYQLTKNNELTAMRACGVSMGRLMVPFMGVGLLATGLTLAINEAVGPYAAFWSDKFLSNEKKKSAGANVYVYKDAIIKLPGTDREWTVKQMDIREKYHYAMSNIVIQESLPDGKEREIQAKSGQYLDGCWWFSDVIIQVRQGGAQTRIFTDVRVGLPDTGREWMVKQFDARAERGYAMSNLVLREIRPDGSERVTIAKSGQYREGGWVFSNATVRTWRPAAADDGKAHPPADATASSATLARPDLTETPDQLIQLCKLRLALTPPRPLGPPAVHASIQMPELTETPKELLMDYMMRRPGRRGQYLSVWEMWDFVQRFNPKDEDLNEILAEFHYRLALPWTCFIVTLLGVPFGNQTGRKGAVSGITMILGMFLAYYILIHLGLWQAKTGNIAGWIGAWMPNLLFLATGGVLVWRMR